MKKHILLGAALLSLFAASCSNDDVIDNGTEVVTGKAITLNATINNGVDTRMTYEDDAANNKMKVAWSSSESFKMYKGTSSTSSTFRNSAGATGTFTGNDITGAGKYYAVYGGNNITNTEGTLTIDLTAAQVGTSAENGIKEFMLASADALGSSTTLAFDHKLTVLKMTLKLPSDVEGTVNKVTVSGLHNKATYDLSKTTDAYAYDNDGKGVIFATNGKKGFPIGSGHSITAYVAIFPENVSANQVTIKAYVAYADYEQYYYYTIAGTRELAAGKVVPINVTLIKTNFQPAYTKNDYFRWDAYTHVYNGDKDTFSKGNYGYHPGSGVTAEHSCASCPTADQMKMYLGAGVYWDNGSTSGDGYYDGNVQTYTVNSKTHHTGLWVKKKVYISGFSEGKAKQSDSETPTLGRPTDIDKYFFLPAAGDCDQNQGFNGYYWSSSSDDDLRYAYCLGFSRSEASVFRDGRVFGYLPMVAE